MKRSLIFCLLLFLLLMGTSCSKTDAISGSDQIYVRKIENIPDDFIFGMDVSSISSLEDSGVVFYDFDGEETDPFRLLSQCGITHIRVRVWNDPYDDQGNGYGGGNCDINNAVEIGKRAKKYGMKLIVDFHYSDFWADPGKQMCPKAWQGMSIEEKASALYNYTKDCLQKLKDARVDVGMVQIGNETNGALAGETIWMNIVYHLMAASSRAIREVFPKALITVHFANPENSDSYDFYAKKLAYYDLDYDVFASSYYPFWHGTLENLASVLSGIAENYGKKVMVMETSYAYTAEDFDFSPNTIGEGSNVIKPYPYSVQGQVNSVLDVIDTIANATVNGIGICYWEGAWIPVGTQSKEENQQKWEQYGSGWASSYAAEYDPNDAGKYYGGTAVDNQALFDPYGHPLESLKLFALCRKGNIIELTADAIEDVWLECDLNDEIQLPEQVNAIMSDGSRKQIEAVWESFDAERIKNSGPVEYVINGLAGGLEAKCHLSMVEFNLLTNGSFEADENRTAVPSGWKVIERGHADELYVEDKQTDSLNGTRHFHFWSAGKDSVEFDLEQTLSDLKTGNYRFSIAIMGGDCGSAEIYAYVRIDDKEIARTPMQITTYDNWDTGVIEPFRYDGSGDLTVGIHVRCSGEGNGAWGKIDSALLNYRGE